MSPESIEQDWWILAHLVQHMKHRAKPGGKLSKPRAVIPPPEGNQVPRALRDEIERVENEEALARKLSREMHDFFEDARHMAAEILSHVHDDGIEQDENVSEKMHEFLHHAAGRVQEFTETLSPAIEREMIATGPRARISVDEPEERIEISSDSDVDDELLDGVETLVTLSGDEDADDAECQHFGNDTWAPPEAGESNRQQHSGDSANDPAPLDFAMELESVLDADLGETLADWCTRLAHDDRRLRDALKHLVHDGFMEKHEAMTIYEAARRARG